MSSAQNYPEDLPLSSINYSSYQPPSGAVPAYLVSFTEGLSGNTITRISDSQVFGVTNQRLKHHYAKDQTWNSDGSLIKLSGYPAAILDGNTYEFLYWSDIPSSATWSNSEPNVMYGTEYNTFVKFDVLTNTRQELYKFSEYSRVDYGYGEGNMSIDDKWVALIGENGSDLTLIVYDVLNDVVTGTKFLGSQGDLDWFSMSQSGDYAVVSWRPNGSGPTEGLKTYNVNMNNEKHIIDQTEHGDLGIDVDGNDVFVGFYGNSGQNQGYYLVSARLDGGPLRLLFNYPGGVWGGHISCRNTDRPGWAYVSEGCCTDHPVAPREIFAIKLDDSNTVERFAKHHSDNISYGHAAMAVPNRSGTKVMFGSNWDNAFTGDYAPSFIVEVPQDNNDNTVVANAGNDVAICEGNSTILTASGGSEYLWNTGETSQSITVNPNTTTTYSVTVLEGAASDNDNVVVTVNPVPTANAGNDVTIEVGQSTTLTASGGTTYQWSTGATSQSITVSPNTTTTYSVTTYQNGCSSVKDDIIVTVVSTGNVTANAGNDVAICEGNSATLTASGGSEYLWNTGETSQSITVNPNTTTTYSITVSEGVASDTDDVIVTVNPMPTANAGNDVTIEVGQSTTLTASGGSIFQWNTGETSQSITVNPNTTTTYSVTVLQNGCRNTDDVLVSTIEPVQASAGEDVSVCNGQSVALTATGGTEYLWDTGEITQSITVSPSHSTFYSVTVSNGISEDSDKVKVTINQCTSPSLDLDEGNVNNIEFTIYPNPTHDIVNIKLTGLSRVSSLQLFDMLGKTLLNEVIQPFGNQTTTRTIDLSSFQRGVYLLSIIQNGTPFTKKIILN